MLGIFVEEMVNSATRTKKQAVGSGSVLGSIECVQLLIYDGSFFFFFFCRELGVPFIFLS